jgi:tetratricopeptide (TPR) repeat protein
MAPKFLKKRKNRLWLTGVILFVCTIISVVLALSEPTAVNKFYEKVFNPEASKILITITPIFIAIIIGFFINILSSDVHETVKQPEKTESLPVEPPVQKIELHYPQPQPERVSSSTAHNPNQKFYPTPFLPDLKFFVGREELLKKIKETLATDHRAAIHDISGLGKTFSTYKYADENKENYEKIFFIRSTKEEMLESLAKCGELVDPQLAEVTEQQVKALGFKQWLEENNKWLVIYDNVDLPNELFPFLPVNKNGDCIFTSNFPEVTNLGTEIGLRKLDKADAEILLYSRAYNRPQTIPDLTSDERTAFDALISEIDGLPLTLNSTGALIHKKPQWNFARFWEKYQKTPEIAWESEDDYSVYQRKSAGIVFSLAYDELCEAEKVGEAVKIVLDSVSFISPDEIPEELLQEVLKTQYEPFNQMDDQQDFWDEVLEKLTAYDLLKYNRQKQVFTTHRAIQRVIQSRTKKEATDICNKLSEIFFNFLPIYDYSNRLVCEKYYQHALALTENAGNLHLETEVIKDIFYRLGRYQELLGNFWQAERFYLRAADVSAIIYGVESAGHAADLNNLANIYQSEGRYDEAVEKFEEALRIDEKTIGKEHPDYASRLNNLANVYRSQGRDDEAIEKYEKALQIAEKTIGREHPSYATYLNNLANVYKSQGRNDEAIEKYEEALRIDEKTIGREHPDHATGLNNLALVYRSQGRYDEAIEKFEEALQIDEKTIGKEHPDYAIRLSNLALVYDSQGRYEEAIEKYEDALRIAEKTVGKGHPSYAIWLSNLAGVYETQGKYEDALVLYEAALRIDRKTLPENHPYTIQDQESVERCRKALESS